MKSFLTSIQIARNQHHKTTQFRKHGGSNAEINKISIEFKLPTVARSSAHSFFSPAQEKQARTKLLSKVCGSSACIENLRKIENHEVCAQKTEDKLIENIGLMQVASVNFSLGQAARTTAVQALQGKIAALSAEISRRLIIDERSAHNDEKERTKYDLDLIQSARNV